MTSKPKECLIQEKVIPGTLSHLNKSAVDWGYQGFIAYGCHYNVVILDTDTLQIIQTLVLHKADIVLVKWAKENYHHDIAKPYTPRLASVDTQGKIIVWDVAQGCHQSFFSEANRTVSELIWLNSQDASVDLMVVIHSPNIVVLWNADTGTKLWKKNYDNVTLLRSLTFDSFNMKNVALLGSDCILFIQDFAINCEPASNGKKFFMTLDKEAVSRKSSLSNSLGAVSKAALNGIKLLMGDEKPKMNEVALMECLQLLYLPALRHHLAAVFPREILMLDVSVLQAVASIPIERSSSPFLRVLPCRQRNALYCVHENGSVSFRPQRNVTLVDKQFQLDEDDKCIQLQYEMACHSESFRVTNKIKPMCGVLCPISETKAAIIKSDGALFIWNLHTLNEKFFKSGNNSTINSNLSTLYSSIKMDPNHIGTLRSLISPLVDSDVNRQKQTKVSLEFTLTGSSSDIISNQITCVKMCPPLTHKNRPYYKPLMAFGLYNGNIQVFNLNTGHLVHEHSVHTCQVRGIEWSSLRSFVSYAYAEPNHNNQVVNEIKVTDLDTGRTMALRDGKGCESAIQFFRISYQRQYLVIVFQAKPFELWDIRSRQFLRELSNSFPAVFALEWAPGHTTRKSKTDFLKEDCENILTKEHLVLTDATSKCYHCIAENSSFKLGSCIPNKNERDAVVTTITWKGDHLLMGNSEGTLTVWDLVKKLSRSVSTYQGTIKKVKFGPGKGNFKVLVLFEDSVDIWDAEKFQCISSFKMSKHTSKVVDIDWCASENAVIALQNSMVVITGLDLKTPKFSNTILNFCSRLPIKSPYFLPSKTAFIFKAIILQGTFQNLEDSGLSTDMIGALQSKLECLQSTEKKNLQDTDTLTRCCVTARIFGDESEIKFFTVLANSVHCDKNSLGIELDFLSENNLFRLSEILRTKRHVVLRHTDNQRRKCVQNLILQGETDHAIQLSLETESDMDKYYTDSLKVCLLSSLKGNHEASLSTVKLVSTNLIANGKLLEGIELLCMIEKPYDACRYLSSHGFWDLAVWLAKVRLSNDHYAEILMNWATYLSSPQVNQKSTAMLVYLSLKQYKKVLESLFQIRRFDRAAVFCDICHEYNLIKSDNFTNTSEQIYTEYARYLFGIGGPKYIIEFYCKKGGAYGCDLLKEIETPSSDVSSSKDWSIIASSNSSAYTSDENEKK